MKNQFILNVVLCAGCINILWLFYFICTTNHSYVIASIPARYDKIIFAYLPTALVLISLVVFVGNLADGKQKNWYAFLPAFVALIPHALYIIGSLLFAM